MLIKFNPLRKINSSYNTTIKFDEEDSDKNILFDINKVKDFSFKNINKFKIGFKTRLKFYFGMKIREGFKLEVCRVIFKRNT